MQRYLDIHSHHIHTDTDTLTLHNLHQHFEQAHHLASCSIGLHPWYLTDHALAYDRLVAHAGLPSVLAIGECGLDTQCATPMDVQSHLFAQQIDLANQVKKPLIIHCVRAYAEAIALLRKASVPVIFHGFEKNAALAHDLVRHGFYLSFGAALTSGKKNAIDSFASVPADRFFLETDTSDRPITAIYAAACAIRKISDDKLVEQLHENYRMVFAQ